MQLLKEREFLSFVNIILIISAIVAYATGDQAEGTPEIKTRCCRPDELEFKHFSRLS